MVGRMSSASYVNVCVCGRESELKMALKLPMDHICKTDPDTDHLIARFEQYVLHSTVDKYQKRTYITKNRFNLISSLFCHFVQKDINLHFRKR